MISHEYVTVDPSELPLGSVIEVLEDRGRVVFRISSDLPAHEIPRALTAAAEAVLAGGRWMQEWRGDIITRRTPARDEGDFEAARVEYVVRRRITAA